MLGPALLVVIGVLFLLNNLYPETFRFGKMWPVILIVIGVSKVLEHLQGRNKVPEERPGSQIVRKEGE